MVTVPTKRRCPWVSADNPLIEEYHDTEWGVPVHDDRTHFEFLTLEGAQAGLSWAIVLKKRPGYRHAFAEFDVAKVARFTETRVDKLMADPGIVRNRLKITSTIRNARAFLQVQEQSAAFGIAIFAAMPEDVVSASRGGSVRGRRR